MLLKTNKKIRIISRSRSPKYEDLIVTDLASENISRSIFKGVSDVIHMAGYAHDVRSRDKEEEYIKINYEATKGMAKIASQSGVSNFIFLSSTKAGNDDNIDTSVEEAGYLWNVKKSSRNSYSRDCLKIKHESKYHKACVNIWS